MRTSLASLVTSALRRRDDAGETKDAPRNSLATLPWIALILLSGCPAEPEPVPPPRSAPTVRPDPIPLHGEAAPGRPATVTDSSPKDGR